jgi:8-oxo-dGTP pyrophosphatase MutT (NUDIX family)
MDDGHPLDLATVVARVAAHDPVSVPLNEAPRRAAVAVVLREPTPGGGVEALYIRRVENPGDPWSGHVAFPGGHVDPDDRDVVHAAAREALEEVGLDLARDATVLGRLNDVRALAGGRVLPMAVTPVVFALAAERAEAVTLRPDPAEVAAVFWVPLERLASGAHDGTLPWRRPGFDSEVTVPCWRIAGECIWGLTYYMTCGLLAVVGRNGRPAEPRFVR